MSRKGTHAASVVLTSWWGDKRGRTCDGSLGDREWDRLRQETMFEQGPRWEVSSISVGDVSTLHLIKRRPESEPRSYIFSSDCGVVWPWRGSCDPPGRYPDSVDLCHLAASTALLDSWGERASSSDVGQLRLTTVDLRISSSEPAPLSWGR